MISVRCIEARARPMGPRRAAAAAAAASQARRRSRRRSRRTPRWSWSDSWSASSGRRRSAAPRRSSPRGAREEKTGLAQWCSGGDSVRPARVQISQRAPSLVICAKNPLPRGAFNPPQPLPRGRLGKFTPAKGVEVFYFCARARARFVCERLRAARRDTNTYRYLGIS